MQEQRNINNIHRKPIARSQAMVSGAGLGLKLTAQTLRQSLLSLFVLWIFLMYGDYAAINMRRQWST